MSEQKHTPGPWEAGPVSDARIGIYSEHGYRVATVHDFNGYTENEANAFLIAAAPELLAALRAVPCDADYASADGFREAIAIWWESVATPAIHRATGA